MDDSLPEEFDVIIVGTGLPESVLSGALSRIDQTVLHIDPQEYYGSCWASFNINSFDELMKNHNLSQPQLEIDLKKHLQEDENFVSIKPRSCFSHCQSSCFLSKVVPEEPPQESNQNVCEVVKTSEETCQPPKMSSSIDEQILEPTDVQNNHDDPDDKETNDNKTVDSSEEPESCEEVIESSLKTTKKECKTPPNPVLSPYDEFYNKWRHFNIDLTCKVMFSRGLLVELLIQSNVSRYLEFRNVSRLLTLMNNSLQPVPCTRADVFKSKLVSVVQKRFLMRILTMCANIDQHPEVQEEFKDKLFVDFLIANKLCDEARHFILHSIAMVDQDTLAMVGIQSTKTFLQSLGRYGNSAFLFPTYGVGELPQAFSRLSAVFGGVFCLRRHAVGYIVDRETGRCKAIIDSKGQRIRCKYLVLDEMNAPDSLRKDFSTCTSRAVYVTDRSLLPSSTEHVTLISVPPSDKNCALRLIEAGPATSVCPRDHYLLHAAVTSSTDDQQPQLLFQPVEDLLFSSSGTDSIDPNPSSDEVKAEGDTIKPKLLWRAYFNMNGNGVDRERLPSNVFVTSPPCLQLGFDSAMAEARNIFEVICPDQEFLPRAPEPEEIIFNDEGYNTEKNENSSSEDHVDDNEGEYDEEDDNSEEQAPADNLVSEEERQNDGNQLSQ